MNETIILEKIGDYKREAKKFIKGLVKSKLFTTSENKILFVIKKGSFDKKLKGGEIKLYTNSSDTGMCSTYKIWAPTRVYNKVDLNLFDSLKDQFSRMKNPIKLEIEIAE